MCNALYALAVVSPPAARLVAAAASFAACLACLVDRVEIPFAAIHIFTQERINTSMQTLYTFSYNPTIATGTASTATNWRMAYQQPLLFYKGTSNVLRLVVYNNAQQVVDLTNYDVQVQIVDKETRQHFVTKTATITTPTTGISTITFTSSDLENLNNRFYHLIARLVDPDDGSSIVDSEILYIDDNYGAFSPITLEDAWNFTASSISVTDGVPSISFTGIDETPNSFLGAASKFLRVNEAETALEFATPLSNLAASTGTGEAEYTLLAADAGAMIYNAGTINIANDSVVDLGDRAVVTIVTGSATCTVQPVDAATIIGEGVGTSGSWIIPVYSIATLLKISEDLWYLKAVGLTSA